MGTGAVVRMDSCKANAAACDSLGEENVQDVVLEAPLGGKTLAAVVHSVAAAAAVAAAVVDVKTLPAAVLVQGYPVVHSE